MSPAFAAGDPVGIQRDRLAEVRELLDRRQAHREDLDRHIDALSLELDQMQLERQAALTGLAGQVDLVRSHERELDRLIPRLLPRLKRLEALRRQGARALADLAAMGREPGVPARTRARLAATTTVSIDQMRRASTSLRLLRRAPNDLVSRHRDLDFQIPLLQTAADRVALRQDEARRQRDGMFRDIADLNVDLERLAADEHRLARTLLAQDLTAGARSSDGAVGERRNVGKFDIGDAGLKSAAAGGSHPRAAPSPLDDVIADAAPSARILSASLPEPAVSGETSIMAAARAERAPADVKAGLSSPDGSWRVAALQAAPLDSLSSRVARGRLRNSEPLVPTRETIGYSLAVAMQEAGVPVIKIPAVPHQRVAAPEDGLIVFADNFKGYGLLLIIEHGNEYHTLLWGFSSLDIGLGDHVRAGQIVGTLGMGQSPGLNVELRRNGEPVSPDVWLAASNSGVKG
jgi:hypothetical protein